MLRVCEAKIICDTTFRVEICQQCDLCSKLLKQMIIHALWEKLILNDLIHKRTSQNQ